MSGARFSVEVWFYSSPHGPDDTFTDFMDHVLPELEVLEGEIAGSVVTHQRRVEFTVTRSGVTFEEAVPAFLADLRRALDSAGRTLPFVPDYQPANRVIRELDTEDNGDSVPEGQEA